MGFPPSPKMQKRERGRPKKEKPEKYHCEICNIDICYLSKRLHLLSKKHFDNIESPNSIPEYKNNKIITCEICEGVFMVKNKKSHELSVNHIQIKNYGYNKYTQYS
jgi:hypothetical protein